MYKLKVEIDRVLQFFTADQKKYVNDIIDYSVNKISKKTFFFLWKCLKSIDESATEDKKELLVEILEQLFVRDVEGNVEVIHTGENLLIEIRLRKNEDLSGSIIVVRDTNHIAISGTSLKGSDSPIQEINCNDLQLNQLTFHRLNVLSEKPDDDEQASGDSNCLLNIVYLYMEKNIDYD